MGVPSSPLDYDTYLARKVGTQLLGPPPTQVINTPPSYPIYSITCNDTNGINLLLPLPTTPYTIAPTSVGVGVAQILCVDSNTNILSNTVIATTQQTLMPIPPAGTFMVEYAFRCTPAVIDVGCGSSDFTNVWQPLQFQNTANVSLSLSFTPNTIASQWINPGATSTTVVGITAYSSSCTESQFTYTTSPNASTQNPVVAGRTISINNTSGNALGIQFYTSGDVLIKVDDSVNGETDYFVVPLNATYFTATTAVLYTITSCGQWPNSGHYPITLGLPLLFRNIGTTDTNVKFFSGPVFVDEIANLTVGSVVLLLSAPGGADSIETACF